MLSRLINMFKTQAKTLYLHYVKDIGWMVYAKTPSVFRCFKGYHDAERFAQESYPEYKLCWYNGKPVNCGDG